MKRLFSLILFIAIILATLQSGTKQVFSLQKDTPEVVMRKYLDAVISNDYQTAYTLVSDQNEDIREWLEFYQCCSRKAYLNNPSGSFFYYTSGFASRFTQRWNSSYQSGINSS